MSRLFARLEKSKVFTIVFCFVVVPLILLVFAIAPTRAEVC